MRREGVLSGRIFDVFILSIAILTICLFVFIGKRMLFREEGGTRKLIIISEAIPMELEQRLAVGDVLYDTLTKRKVGTVTSLKTVYRDDCVRFVIKTDAAFTPSSDALRTRELWFYVRIAEEVAP